MKLIKFKWKLAIPNSEPVNYKEVPLYLREDTILALETNTNDQILVLTNQPNDGKVRAYLVTDSIDSILKQMKK